MKYALVGGGSDGAEIELPANLPAGTEIRVQVPHDHGRCEVYVAVDEGRFRFDRRESLPDNELNDALRPVIAKLGAALTEIEAVYRRHGVVLSPLQINNWMLHPL